MSSSPRRLSGLSPAEAFACDHDSQCKQLFLSTKSKADLSACEQGPDGSGPAQNYNALLQPGQEHLTLRPGLYLTHINDTHLVEVPCEEIIRSLQSTPRPVTLRFVDVEAGVVTRHELRNSLRLDGDELSAVIASLPGSSASPPRRQSSSQQVVRSESATYKIILLGTAGVGKSSLLAVAVNGDEAYSERHPPTLEAEFGSLEFPDPNGSTTIKARIWDTAGQERFRAITRSHYRRADGAVLVYDVSDAESFERLGEWLHTLRETADDSLAAVMVVENKIDMLPTAATPRPSEFAQIDRVKDFCDDRKLLFARTTAKLNARAADWDQAMKAADAVKKLVLAIHAVRTGTNTGTTLQSKDKVVLTETLTAPKTSTGDCGGCSSN
ncbi:hypothetical protein PHYBOEH_007259 [Phytophthora boehmeriae]|uniref:Rab11 family GTPase n=1 Tax=Phytophthora boehmeriae TaxID=109152 RepID=A0A8T1X7Q4_9STRA|nr:hypothetical protein PHYBOEH_007259 [Phytophthora boehmeriae]